MFTYIDQLTLNLLQIILKNGVLVLDDFKTAARK